MVNPSDHRRVLVAFRHLLRFKKTLPDVTTVVHVKDSFKPPIHTGRLLFITTKFPLNPANVQQDTHAHLHAS